MDKDVELIIKTTEISESELKDFQETIPKEHLKLFTEERLRMIYILKKIANKDFEELTELLLRKERLMGFHDLSGLFQLYIAAMYESELDPVLEGRATLLQQKLVSRANKHAKKPII